MKTIKIICTLFLIYLFTPTNLKAQIKIGVGAGYITEPSTVLLQGRLVIGPRSFHMSNAFSFVLEDGLDWALDIDGHYELMDIDDEIFFDVFPGLNVLKGGGDTDIGLNLGGTVKFQTRSNIIYIEPKYTIGTYDSFTISGGLIF